MNKRKLKKQIKLGNTYLGENAGNGRNGFVVNMSIKKQLLMYNAGVKPKVIKRNKWRNVPRIMSIRKHRYRGVKT